MKEILTRRQFFKEGLKQLAGIVGIGVGVKALMDNQATQESLGITDIVVDHNASIGNQMQRTIWEHEIRLRQLEGKPIIPQKAEGERRI